MDECVLFLPAVYGCVAGPVGRGNEERSLQCGSSLALKAIDPDAERRCSFGRREEMGRRGEPEWESERQGAVELVSTNKSAAYRPPGSV